MAIGFGVIKIEYYFLLNKSKMCIECYNHCHCLCGNDYINRTKRVIDYKKRFLPRKINSSDLNIYVTTRYIESGEVLKINKQSSFYNIYKIYINYKTKNNKNCLLDYEDFFNYITLFLIKKKSKVNIVRKYDCYDLDFVGNTFIFHNKLKYENFELLVKIPNLKITVMIEYLKTDKYCKNCLNYVCKYSKTQKFIYKNAINWDNYWSKRKRMNPEELERELVAWYWKPERFELFKWQLDLE
jgi:hypothetical protein